MKQSVKTQNPHNIWAIRSRKHGHPTYRFRSASAAGPVQLACRQWDAFYGFEQQQRSERASPNRTEVCEYIGRIEIPIAVNEMVYNTSISLNRAFVFGFVNLVRFRAPPKDPARNRVCCIWGFREAGQFPSQTTTSGSQLGGGEIIIDDLWVTIFDAVLEFNLKWSNLLTKQLCCTLLAVAPRVFEFARKVHRRTHRKSKR